MTETQNDDSGSRLFDRLLLAFCLVFIGLGLFQVWRHFSKPSTPADLQATTTETQSQKYQVIPLKMHTGKLVSHMINVDQEVGWKQETASLIWGRSSRYVAVTDEEWLRICAKPADLDLVAVPVVAQWLWGDSEPITQVAETYQKLRGREPTSERHLDNEGYCVNIGEYVMELVPRTDGYLVLSVIPYQLYQNPAAAGRISTTEQMLKYRDQR